MTSPDRGSPDHQQIRRYYDDEYYGRSSKAERLPWHTRAVAARLGDLRGKAVLDVACGTGLWLEELGRIGASRLSGIDISSLAVQGARKRLPDADLREGVAEILPFDSACFDLVTCMGSLEHFLDQLSALHEMRRVAKSGATFLILVPNAGFLTRRLGLYGGTGQAAVRETVRPLDEWTALLGQAGLCVAARWRDLHVVSLGWITQGSVLTWPIRAMQAGLLMVSPVQWQYQVYFLCSADGERDGK